MFGFSFPIYYSETPLYRHNNKRFQWVNTTLSLKNSSKIAWHAWFWSFRLSSGVWPLYCGRLIKVSAFCYTSFNQHGHPDSTDTMVYVPFGVWLLTESHCTDLIESYQQWHNNNTIINYWNTTLITLKTPKSAQYKNFFWRQWFIKQFGGTETR